MTHLIARAPMTGKLNTQALEVETITDQAQRNLAAATQLHTFLFSLDNGQDLVTKLTDELAALDDEQRADRLEQWFDWADEMVAIQGQLDEAQKAIDAHAADASGMAGWTFQAVAWEYSKTQAETKLERLASGPTAASLICRVCAVEGKVKRERKWVRVGTCPFCYERHALYRIQDERC